MFVARNTMVHVSKQSYRESVIDKERVTEVLTIEAKIEVQKS